MRILITGGTGIISSGIAKEALNRGHEVYVINRGSKKNLAGVNTIIADVRNTDNILSLIGDLTFDVVVECLVYNTSQLQTSLNTFSGLCKQYIFISTADVYDRKNHTGTITEDYKKYNMDWDYPKNKLECEDYLIAFSKNNNLTYTIIRPPVVYGDLRIPYPISSRKAPGSFFNRIKHMKPIIGCENDNTIFTMIHSSDFSNCIVSLFLNPNAYNEIFHIGNSTLFYHWDDVGKCISRIMGMEVRIIHIPMTVYKKLWNGIYHELKYNKCIDLLLDDSKIRTAADNMAYPCDLTKGMSETYNYWTSTNMDEASVDVEWEKMCDYLICYCVKNKLLCEDEHIIAQKYIKQMSTRDYVQMKVIVAKLRFVGRLKQNRLVRTSYHKLKKLLHVKN